MRRLFSGLAMLVVAAGAQTPAHAESLLQKLKGAADNHSFNDTHFTMRSCEITADRTAICILSVSNQYRDKKIEVTRNITIQDDRGNDYAVTSGGFGTVSNRPQWDQIAVADTSYQLTVIAPNLSSQATAVRAVVFPRLLVRSPQGQTLGYRDQVIFSKPPMLASATSVEATAPAAPVAPSPSPKPVKAKAAPKAETPFTNSDLWIVVGYWDYDAVDGQFLPANGLVLRNLPGGNLGVQWSAHLELKNHAALPPRARNLWPVTINPAQRKVCANYPDYPTYPAKIDLPGEAADGEYLVSNCNAG